MLNSNLFPKGDYANNCLFLTKDNWVGTSMIPLLNANNYTITLTGIVMFGDSSNSADISGWDIKKSKNKVTVEEARDIITSHMYWSIWECTEHGILSESENPLRDFNKPYTITDKA